AERSIWQLSPTSAIFNVCSLRPETETDSQPCPPTSSEPCGPTSVEGCQVASPRTSPALRASCSEPRPQYECPRPPDASIQPPTRTNREGSRRMRSTRQLSVSH